MNESFVGEGKANDSSHLLSTLKNKIYFQIVTDWQFHQDALFFKWFEWQVLISVSGKDKTSLCMSAASSHFKIERKQLILVRG